ncbi:endonuclease/exonuclease/phosphatase family protein [Actinoplanes aureus]|uniref:Endonuclease/exonuclease/phosphatase family protein n=1 Tax=Actinoplanes aureus TaxID=2792083 RepID=A0A931FWI3_9ACTN|nr:endonuclease/exonuclease/phosphatase family protein [Actinoplanes aureus]MBG0561375.1 endonuclease/exonuclease/phosphatase family protein [Actinoplanes aureus]
MNLWNRHGAWQRRRSILADGLRRLAPDVVAFQEAVVADGYDQVSDLLGPGYQVAHQTGREADGSGCSIASRWPLDRHEEVHLRVTPRVDPAELAGRLALVEIAVPAPIGPLLVAHHKPSGWLGYERERELQAVAAARRIEQRRGDRDAHVVLLGDFDAEPDSASMRFWSGRQSLDGFSVAYRDAWAAIRPTGPGHTFSPDNPLVTGGNWPLELGRRIDYVLVRCDRHGPTLRVTGCRRVFDQPVDGVWASDHFGVVADLAAVPGDQSRSRTRRA